MSDVSYHGVRHFMSHSARNGSSMPTNSFSDHPVTVAVFPSVSCGGSVCNVSISGRSERLTEHLVNQLFLIISILCFCRFLTMAESMVQGRNLLCCCCSNSIHPWVCQKLRGRQISCTKPLKGKECKLSMSVALCGSWVSLCRAQMSWWIHSPRFSSLLCRALLLDLCECVRSAYLIYPSALINWILQCRWKTSAYVHTFS